MILMLRCFAVALRKESVDRNMLPPPPTIIRSVALRKESVDRNFAVIPHHRDDTASLSARRAWIEIAQGRRFSGRALVALRKESVDRNPVLGWRLTAWPSRSPQGERG